MNVECVGVRRRSNNSIRGGRDALAFPKATAEYLDGRLDGVSRVYSPSGTLLQEMYYPDGEPQGPYRSWWDAGTVKELGEYAQAQRIGVYSRFNEDGTLRRTHYHETVAEPRAPKAYDRDRQLRVILVQV